ncbi:MAG: hypothetical protein OEU68_07985 [Nitrospira sp.]|nr:hypothetical protein [Nitrospira sp.]MDH4242213.1 hypothetical protein [Nitrospira sp.]MDH4356272.1 hypothetical protein [Nitrospira sp.]MDH5317609.1 hypothetical protein [Nitrospira sp.]
MHSLQRATNDFYIHAFREIGMRIIRKDARHEAAERDDFLLRDRFWPASATDDLNNIFFGSASFPVEKT